jgi:3-hydroxyisobutyrate dehydrogenase-like beta-hydroxyacid dehydrogenase
MVGGDKEAFEKCRPVFEATGKNLTNKVEPLMVEYH